MPTREAVRRYVRKTFKLDKKDRRTEPERERDRRTEEFVKGKIRGNRGSS